MSPPPNGALWRPVERLGDLDVILREGRIELVDRRLWVELVSLSPSEAAALGAVLGEHARRGGWSDRGQLA